MKEVIAHEVNELKKVALIKQLLAAPQIPGAELLRGAQLHPTDWKVELEFIMSRLELVEGERDSAWDLLEELSAILEKNFSSKHRIASMMIDKIARYL